MSNRAKLWVSRSFSTVITLALIVTATMKISHLPKTMVNGLTRAGIPGSAVIPIAILELTCLALYLIPRTMVLGAVLLTGYFGGEIVVHLIGGQSVFPLVLIGLVAWGGIYFRVPSLQSLLPVRSKSANGE